MPALAALVAVSFRTLLPDPEADRLVEVKAPETPQSSPVTEKATAALKPLLTVTFRVTLSFDPSVLQSRCRAGLRSH
jgi:hypothetical protein